MNTKTVDSKGRVSIGRKFAGKTFIVKEDSETVNVILTPGPVIPAREIWLHGNAEAIASVKRGLEELVRGKFSENPPDLEADAAFVASIPDEMEAN